MRSSTVAVSAPRLDKNQRDRLRRQALDMLEKDNFHEDNTSDMKIYKPDEDDSAHWRLHLG